MGKCTTRLQNVRKKGLQGGVHSERGEGFPTLLLEEGFPTSCVPTYFGAPAPIHCSKQVEAFSKIGSFTRKTRTLGSTTLEFVSTLPVSDLPKNPFDNEDSSLSFVDPDPQFVAPSIPVVDLEEKPESFLEQLRGLKKQVEEGSLSNYEREEAIRQALRRRLQKDKNASSSKMSATKDTRISGGKAGHDQGTGVKRSTHIQL